MNDAVGFGCSIAIAGAAAAVAVFWINGRRRWALEIVLSVLLVGAIAALASPLFPLARPDLRCASRWTSGLSFGFGMNPYAGRHNSPDTTGRWGAASGLALGAVAGLLIKLGQKRPRLATGMALAILFAFASDSGRQFAFRLVTWLGLILRYLFVHGSISDDQISTTAMIFGAIAGVLDRWYSDVCDATAARRTLPRKLSRPGKLS